MKIFGCLTEKNIETRKVKKQVEQIIDSLNENLLEISTKYIKLLEQKSEQFDLYVKYRDECVEFANKNKEQKKEIALLKEEIKKIKENAK